MVRMPLIVAAVAAVLLGGCHRGENTANNAARPATPSAAPGADADPAMADALKGMAPGVSLGPSDAPVDVRFGLPSWPVSGQPFTVQVAVLPGAAIPTIRVDVTSDADLKIIAPTATVALDKVAAGAPQTMEITAQSSEPGARVINVTVTADLPTGPLARAFAYPVIVAEGPRPTT
jgi:hypothetical protein